MIKTNHSAGCASYLRLYTRQVAKLYEHKSTMPSGEIADVSVDQISAPLQRLRYIAVIAHNQASDVSRAINVLRGNVPVNPDLIGSSATFEGLACSMVGELDRNAINVVEQELEKFLDEINSALEDFNAHDPKTKKSLGDAIFKAAYLGKIIDPDDLVSVKSVLPLEMASIVDRFACYNLQHKEAQDRFTGELHKSFADYIDGEAILAIEKAQATKRIERRKKAEKAAKLLKGI